MWGCLNTGWTCCCNWGGKHQRPLKGAVQFSKESTSPSMISLHVCARMCATVILKVPAAMGEVSAVGGRMGDRQKEGRGYCRQHSAHFCLSHSSLGNHGYRREHVPLEVWGSVRCVFGSVLDAHRALPLSSNSPALVHGGGLGKEK